MNLYRVRRNNYNEFVYMIPTVEYLQEYFRIYNEKYFYSKLPMPRIFVRKMGVRRLGQYRHPISSTDGQPEIRITGAYDGDERFFQKGLIHEMIHYYLDFIQDDDPQSHGRSFKREAARINKDGWNIQRCATKEDMARTRFIGRQPIFPRGSTLKERIVSWMQELPVEEQVVEFILSSSYKDKEGLLWVAYPTIQSMIYAELLEDHITEEYRQKRCKAIERAMRALLKFHNGNAYNMYVLHKDYSCYYRSTGNEVKARKEEELCSRYKDAEPSSFVTIKGKPFVPIALYEKEAALEQDM